MQITLGRVLKAALIFKGIMIEWVTVKGYDETFDDDLWAESRHQVFRKVQDHTHSAMLHFSSPTLPDLAVKFFMVIGSCSKLKGCKTDAYLLDLFRHGCTVI